MGFVAFVCALVALVVFVVEFARSNGRNLVALGLALLTAALMLWHWAPIPL